MFRQANVKRRCIIPASGFYEWTGPKGDKVPHYFTVADGGLVGFAGLWEAWKDPEGTMITSCTIITRDADKWMSSYHNTMPAMLHPRGFRGMARRERRQGTPDAASAAVLGVDRQSADEQDGRRRR